MSVESIALSRQVIIERQLEMLAHNAANASTPGFKTERLSFKDQTNDSGVSYASEGSIVRDYSPGAIKHTGNEHDLAIQGDGFFAVRDAEGEVFYTRNGHFHINNQNQLVNSSGQQVLALGDAEIGITPDQAPLRIDGDGFIYGSNGEEITQLNVVTFENADALVDMGGTVYRAPEDEEPLPATNARILQYSVEGSNVNTVEIMTELMKLTREFQYTQENIQQSHQQDTNAIKKLAGNDK